MRKQSALVVCGLLCAGVAQAQFGRGDGLWSTTGGDAQRSSWVRTDSKISKESLSKPGFALAWKMKLANDPRGLNGIMPPPLMDRYIGVKGFRSFAFVAGSSDNIYGIDTDLGRADWQTHFSTTPAKDSTATCPGGMTANAARPVTAAFPAAQQAGRGGGGFRGQPAKSAVGESGEGAVTIAEVAARAAAANGGRGGFPGAGRGQQRRMPVVVYALASDGKLHTAYVSNGHEPDPAIEFLPANANAQALSILDNVAYVTTTGGCGGVPDAVWALDLESKKVSNWKPTGKGGITVGAGPAFGPDGTLYVSTADGDLVSLEAKTLKVKDVFRAGQELTSSPVIFQHNDKAMIAVATKDGTIHVIDSASMNAVVAKSQPYSSGGEFAPAALASWQDSSGTRWILAPAPGATVAWKFTDKNGAMSLESGWVSRDMTSPAAPLVVNGVVFALSTGEFRSKDTKMTAAQRVQKSTPAVLYALDGMTGKELWNSGKTMTSFAHTVSIAGGAGQIYVGTHDGTLYAFGFPIEH